LGGTSASSDAEVFAVGFSYAPQFTQVRSALIFSDGKIRQLEPTTSCCGRKA
jgi:hypothetical protein